jgi:N-acetylglucosamine-6-phosphate deacetylase
MHTGKTDKLVIEKGSALLPDGELRICDVLVEGGRIKEIGNNLKSEWQIDATNSYVLPGLIDLHTHGIGWESVGAGTLKEYARIEASCGATTFYPTLFAPPEEIARQMERHRQQTDELRQIPQVGGFRLESPYLAHTGAGLSRDLAPITGETTNFLLAAGGGYVKIWDISPELPGAPELIRQLTREGIVGSISHTQGTIEEARMAVDAGARLVTHMFDTFVLPKTTDSEPGVYPAGLVDYLLIEDRVTCEIIADGTHVDPLLLEKTFRCKTPNKIAFITDSNYGAGLPPGEYVLPENRGRVRIKGSNNGVRLIERGMGLAGSALTPINAFRNAVQLFGKDIATASQVCSKTPAQLMGLNKGEIAVGKDADFIILNSDFELLYTMVAGMIVYEKE